MCVCVCVCVCGVFIRVGAAIRENMVFVHI